MEFAVACSSALLMICYGMCLCVVAVLLKGVFRERLFERFHTGALQTGRVFVLSPRNQPEGFTEGKPL